MPSYQKFVSVAFDVAKSKGARFDKDGDGPPKNSAAVMRLAADIWNEDKDQIKAMTKTQARNLLEDEIVIK